MKRKRGKQILEDIKKYGKKIRKKKVRRGRVSSPSPKKGRRSGRKK